jgi:hypothetical protein
MEKSGPALVATGLSRDGKDEAKGIGAGGDVFGGPAKL